MRYYTMTTILWLSAFMFMTACEAAGDQKKPASLTASSAGSAVGKPDGMAIFRQYCVLCHGADGKMGLNGAKDLTQSLLTLEERINIVTHGKKLMTPFNEILSPEEIKAVSEYTLTLKK